MKQDEKTLKLAKLRNQVKKLITKYNDLEGNDKSHMILITYGLSSLYTKEEIEHAYDESREDTEKDFEYGIIDGEYVNSERPVIFGDEKGWLPSSVNC